MQNVGIVDMVLYAPPTYALVSDMEPLNPARSLEGLIIREMAVCGPENDSVSLGLSATRKLLAKHPGIAPLIGFLHVGTESSVDKSKSISSFIRQLPELAEATNVGCCDHVHACYGGTDAFLACVKEMSSPFWDPAKRYGLVVATDIAVYQGEKAIPSGGAGAVCVLIGPDAPLIANPDPVYAGAHYWDFFKPHLGSEYPIVNGRESIDAYMANAADCYTRWADRTGLSLDDCARVVTHVPFGRQALKAMGKFIELHCERTGVELTEARAQELQSRLLPALRIPRRTGNSYTASVFTALMSTVLTGLRPGDRVLVYSYGSGHQGTMYTVTANPAAPVDIEGPAGWAEWNRRETAWEEKWIGNTAPSGPRFAGIMVPGVLDLLRDLDGRAKVQVARPTDEEPLTIAHIDVLRRREQFVSTLEAQVAALEPTDLVTVAGGAMGLESDFVLGFVTAGFRRIYSTRSRS
ncbi:Hydroxymethyl-glutaryl-CoA lyase [Carpediemonas membranifera]|uniref:Hydroxymethyl-glutaryl-CoA lyase n=1 Tax=Carpediemonas membranifera TaxID=201153 RepID=A0A8J6AZ39_9EUKA|nr:Hydroxymethyl-glutaryl-CoA lyase [Carpediemonas membranifera]|eukprot:KAG9391953.1 Hydroxymethyl-glutaryl-CoA lyase [Carpediemonas membranifera]